MSVESARDDMDVAMGKMLSAAMNADIWTTAPQEFPASYYFKAVDRLILEVQAAMPCYSLNEYGSMCPNGGCPSCIARAALDNQPTSP